MLTIIVLIVLVVLAIAGACFYIEHRANEQDPKYMKIRDNLMDLCKN